MTTFDAAVISGVTGHMNGDHTDDNLLIARAFGVPGATASEMVGLDGEAGVWRVTDATGEHELRVEWPGGPISERPQIRREVVLLYRAACEKLGVDEREEHGAAPAAGAGAGAGHSAAHAAHGHAGPESAEGDRAEKPFSVVLREGSWSDHSDSEGAGFMENIMRGKGTLGDYVALVAQHYFMYEALEEAAERFADDPRFAPFHPAALSRLGALEEDLAHLLGDGWRDDIEALPATERYAARIREIGEEGWLAGLIAHHYTRYLGDLSGGQMIARRVAKQHGLGEAGVAFYAFPDLGDLTEFKNRYRAELDRFGETLTAEERERMLAEVRAAYRFNTEAFIDLAKAKPEAA